MQLSGKWRGGKKCAFADHYTLSLRTSVYTRTGARTARVDSFTLALVRSQGRFYYGLITFAASEGDKKVPSDYTGPAKRVAAWTSKCFRDAVFNKSNARENSQPRDSENIFWADSW